MPESVCDMCGWPIEEWQDSRGADVEAWLGDWNDMPLIHANPADHRPTRKPGEPEETWQSVFERFFSASERASRKGDGDGR